MRARLLVPLTQVWNLKSEPIAVRVSHVSLISTNQRPLEQPVGNAVNGNDVT